ncbi:type II toxin-antitoxin system death-on-curing family toxin [Escherichia coli]|uniref:type II toxin-antitoxin system death-on-curing family toxin n=1 Tax=Escherichia coli TaxID=562 RepID=UPI003D81BB5C
MTCQAGRRSGLYSHHEALSVLPVIYASLSVNQFLVGGVQARVVYEEITDLFEVSATYLVATARGHIFNDANKRTALNSALLFLRRNGVQVFDSPELADLTVGAATGEISVSSVADTLRRLYGSAE